jgi:pilus assembly protein CpaF
MAATGTMTLDTAYAAGLGQAQAESVLRLQATVHERLLADTDLQELQQMTRTELLERIGLLAGPAADSLGVTLTTRGRQQVLQDVFNEIRGFGPIQPLLDDGTVSEVMVNGPHAVFVERQGKVEEVNRRFLDNAHVMRIINRIIAPLGRRLDEAMPMVDARLPDGSRVNAIIPPVSVTGPCITIRKFSREPYTTDDLVRFGTFTDQMCDFLRACVEARLNILVAGGTGSGKTTTLNVLSAMIPPGERIVTIEDAAELQLQQRHVITLEARPPNLEGKGDISIRMLVMTLMAGTELPSRAIREQIASAIHLIVQQSRMRDGTRKVTHITEVQGMEGDHIIVQDLYQFKQEGVDGNGRVIGHHMTTGLRPLFADALLAQGIRLPAELFQAWSGGRNEWRAR